MVARQMGLHERTVRRIVANHVSTLKQTVAFETPDWLGLDEIYILGKDCGVVTNVERRYLVCDRRCGRRPQVGAEAADQASSGNSPLQRGDGNGRSSTPADRKHADPVSCQGQTQSVV